MNGGMELSNGLLALLFGIFDPAESLLVGPGAQLAGQGPQSYIVTWLLHHIKAFHLFSFYLWK